MSEQAQHPDYRITWITPCIATGRAPKSYDDLDFLRDQGIVAILNLCGEFCDLHELEQNAGFEVFWLPTPDETAPSMQEMEEGLAWLDEAVYLGKKVLIHCYFGIGRTGTFLTAYLLRRGFSLKKAGKALKQTQTMASPSNFSQWWLLRKFGKKEGQLTIGEPDMQNRRHDELTPFFTRYELLLDAIDRTARPPGREDTEEGTHTGTTGNIGNCCDQVEVEIHFIEALYLNTRANVVLSAAQRRELIENSSTQAICALFMGEKSPLAPFRPASCRLRESSFAEDFAGRINKELAQLSSDVFAAVFSIRTDQTPPLVQIDQVISGRFIQHYFQILTSMK